MFTKALTLPALTSPFAQSVVGSLIQAGLHTPFLDRNGSNIELVGSPSSRLTIIDGLQVARFLSTPSRAAETIARAHGETAEYLDKEALSRGISQWGEALEALPLSVEAMWETNVVAFVHGVGSDLLKGELQRGEADAQQTPILRDLESSSYGFLSCGERCWQLRQPDLAVGIKATRSALLGGVGMLIAGASMMLLGIEMQNPWSLLVYLPVLMAILKIVATEIQYHRRYETLLNRFIEQGQLGLANASVQNTIYHRWEVSGTLTIRTAYEALVHLFLANERPDETIATLGRMLGHGTFLDQDLGLLMRGALRSGQWDLFRELEARSHLPPHFVGLPPYIVDPKWYRLYTARPVESRRREWDDTSDHGFLRNDFPLRSLRATDELMARDPKSSFNDREITALVQRGIAELYMLDYLSAVETFAHARRVWREGRLLITLREGTKFQAINRLQALMQLALFRRGAPIAVTDEMKSEAGTLARGQLALSRRFGTKLGRPLAELEALIQARENYRIAGLFEDVERMDDLIEALLERRKIRIADSGESSRAA